MLRSSLAAFALLVALASASASASQRAYVSAISGDDANIATGCVVTAPCRWFTGAISAVDPGGELVVLDSGAYGTVTITKSISIISAPGVYAGISVFSGDGITIATSGIHVVLRGLNINRISGSGNGINMTAGDSLVVENCVITNFGAGSGLLVSSDALVRVLDSLLRGNGYGARFWAGKSVLVSGSRLLENAMHGISFEASGPLIGAVISRSEASGNGSVGFYAQASIGWQVRLNVKDSVATRNGSGVFAHSGAGTMLASVSNSLMSENTNYGLGAQGEGAKLVASGNKVTHNGTGLAQTYDSVLQSTGDNTVSDNTTAFTGTITTINKM